MCQFPVKIQIKMTASITKKLVILFCEIVVTSLVRMACPSSPPYVLCLIYTPLIFGTAADHVRSICLGETATWEAVNRLATIHFYGHFGISLLLLFES